MLGFVAALLLPASASAADSIYWASESGFVGVGNLDGSGTAATLFGSEGGPCGVAIDPAADKIYWTNFSSGTVRVANLDGTGTASTLTNASSEGNPCGVAVDPAANKIYWANYSSGTIRVGNLDGSGTAATLFGSEGGPSGVAIDPAANKIYWTNQTSGTVRVANLDGSGTAATLFGSESNPIGLAIDPAANKIYWANLSSGAIRVANLDGSGTASDLFGGEASPAGVAIDPAANKIYWGNFGSGAIRVANLDGTGTASDLFTGQGLANFPVLLRAPTGTGPPTISGEPRVGEELSCSQGNWAPDLLGAFLFRAPRSSFEYQWLMDGGEIGGETAPTFTPTEPGTYACRVTASNQAGSSSQTSADVTVPAPQPPQTQVDSGPSGRTNDPTPTFTFSSPDTGSSFECKVDSGSYSACSSPKTTAHLTDGSHTFSVRAKDSSNVDPTPSLALIHGPDRRGQRLWQNLGRDRRARGQGQPGDHPSFFLDPTGDRSAQRPLHGFRCSHRRGLHPKRRLHSQLHRRNRPGPGHRRRPERPGRQLDRGPKLAQRREWWRHADRRIAQRHPYRRAGRRHDEGDERKRSAEGPRPDLRHAHQLRRRDRDPRQRRQGRPRQASP